MVVFQTPPSLQWHSMTKQLQKKKTRCTRFVYGKKGLWENWYDYSPQREWLPPDVCSV